jgi:single-strand DNA-binding protein
MPKRNHIVVIGHLGKDPELKTVKDQQVCKFSVATDVRKKNGDKWETVHTDWHFCEVWGSLAGIVANTFEKGKAIHVEGQQHHREHDGKYYATIRADYIAIPLYRKSEQTGDAPPDVPPPDDDSLPF